MKNRINLSHVICKDTPSYGNRDHILINKNSSIKDGETANTSSWSFSNNHIGTHIDTPNHFSEKGKKSYEIDINNFFFNEVQVIDLPCNKAKLIESNDLLKFKDSLSPDLELLLIRTGYEKYRQKNKYWNDNPGLSSELANFLRKTFPELRCVGFDFISLTSWKFRDEGKKSHLAFLCPSDDEKEILIIEDMKLSEIKSNINKVIVAPIFVEDGNGGAVTVFAELA